MVPNPIRKRRGLCPTLPSGNQNIRLLGITESKRGIPSHFMAPVNSRMVVVGEKKKKEKVGEKMEEKKQSDIASNACLGSLVVKYSFSTCMLNTDYLTLHISNAFCHASLGEILLWLTLELLM
jgi:hypothetical protein